MRSISPWLLLALGLMLGVPAGRLTLPPQDKPAASATPAAAPVAAAPAAAAPASETFSCKGTAAAPAPPWCEPVRLLGDFLGRPPRAAAARDKLAADLAQGARDDGYDLHFLVALVPAPPDPRLDQALEAVQR